MPTTWRPSWLMMRSDAKELLRVVAAGRDAGEVGVALKVIHAVGIQVRSAHELAQRRVSAGRVRHDQPEHVAGVDLERGDALGDVGQRQHIGRAPLVTNPENLLAGVAEGPVADVVQQQRRAHEAPLIRHVAFVAEEMATVAHQLVECARAHCERAERVREARMLGGRKREVREAQLPQAAQTLHRRKIEQSRFRCG